MQYGIDDRPDIMDLTYGGGSESPEVMGDFGDLINEIRSQFRKSGGELQLKTSEGVFQMTPEGLKLLKPSVEKPGDQFVDMLKNPVVIGSIAVLLLLLFMGKK